MRVKALCILVLMLASSLVAKAQWKYEIPFPKPMNYKEDTVSVCIIGDMMMHSKQLEYDCSEFISRLGSLTENADIAVANMEFALGGEPYSGYPAFSTPDYYADYASERGIDVFLTANNHILDKGVSGLTRTVDKYRKMNVQFTGTALDEQEDSLVNPLITVRKGIRIAMINFTYGTNSGKTTGFPKVHFMDKDDLTAQIERARRKGADFVFVFPHWGEEYSLKHSVKQREWAEWLCSQDIDLIVGAHPHVVQDTTHINGVPVIYSVGNAVSNMSAENTRLELAVTVKIVRNRQGELKMLEPELDFLWCTLPGRMIDNYATVRVRDYVNRREEWKLPSDYDNMIQTLKRVIKATGIETDIKTQ